MTSRWTRGRRSFPSILAILALLSSTAALNTSISAPAWADEAPSPQSAPAAPLPPQAAPSADVQNREDSATQDNSGKKEQSIQDIVENMPESVLRKRVNLFANGFYLFLIQGRLEYLKKISNLPFYFEDRRADGEDAFVREMDRIIASPRFRNLKIKRYQVFSVEEMEKNFGPRPQKLSEWPIVEGAYFSVAEIGDSAVVVLWHPKGDDFEAVAIHD